MDRLTGELLAARAGDDAALATVVRLAQPDVRRFLRPLVDPADLDDVAQETFLRAYRALPRFRGDASGRTWLLAIARRAAADATRRRVRRRRADERLAHQRTGTGGGDGENGAEHALLDLVDRLHPDQRVAFVLTQVVGCSYVEAAAVCGVPVGTIRSRVARAREWLVGEALAAQSV
jgi:RNA polymerase sigma-70 factor (ECF subfamily)